MRIAFIHTGQAFLPEITAYHRFFAARGVTCEVISPRQLELLKPDVAWHFMGTDRHKKLPGQVVIHEYTSASVPPAADLKNLYKKWFNAKPDYRLFLNSYVEKTFSFNDGVPSGIRDMGVPAEWLQNIPAPEKEYDFIYVGEARNRGLEDLLKAFVDGAMMAHTVVLVTKEHERFHPLLLEAPNIIFKEPVPHAQVRELICKARYGINFIPDKLPFTRQTSTKLLEYAACRIPIITTNYEWLRDFQNKYGGKYFMLANDLSNLRWDAIQQAEYDFPDLTGWTWERQILSSGIPAFLEKHFGGISLTAY